MTKLSPRISFLAILSLFLLPLLIAWWMYASRIEFAPGETRNLGQLVAPVVELDWSGLMPGASTADDPPLLGHWVVLYPMPEECGSACIEQVTGLRQVHRATGRNEDRITIALLAAAGADQPVSEQLLAIYPRFEVLGPATDDAVAALAQASRQTGGSAVLYLVDPLGNIMMTYPEPVNLNDLRKDLKQLLTWSKQDQGQ